MTSRKYRLPTRLRRLRLEHGLTARALGDRIGRSDRQIYRYEWGTSEPPADVVVRIARRFKCSPEWLMGWT